jgi:exodeoxyribonuclease-5
MNKIKLSPDQEQALSKVMDWYLNYSKQKQSFTLGGYAGTGKTTMIAFFRNELARMLTKLKKSGKRDPDYTINVAFCTYTGKAAQVIKSKIQNYGASYDSDSYSTIHSLIYSPLTNSSEEIVGWERKQSLNKNLIIVDEASMVDRKIWEDLMKYKIPILAVGDHGQLPPISGKFNLMQDPDHKLEKIHRQVEGNPIIELSIQARESGEIPVKQFNPKVIKADRQDFLAKELVDDVISSFDSDTLILCGFNSTRVKLNQSVRAARDIYSEEPVSGERVICLRNNHTKQIFNGMLGEIVSIEPHDENFYYAEITFDESGRRFSGLIVKEQFHSKNTLNPNELDYNVGEADLFDFGYAMTVHKAQGSQAKRVLLIEERFPQMDDEMWRRWLYTGITRAEAELYVVGSDPTRS